MTVRRKRRRTFMELSSDLYERHFTLLHAEEAATVFHFHTVIRTFTYLR